MHRRARRRRISRPLSARTIADIIGHDLDVLFCGINPGLYSAATGHHFARPGNRFWPALHAGGFTPRVLKPWEERELLSHKCGVTNLVDRATVAAAELSREELRAGRARLERKCRRYRPRLVAIVGIGAYQTAFERPQATLGAQTEDWPAPWFGCCQIPAGSTRITGLPTLRGRSRPCGVLVWRQIAASEERSS
jgi:TDG/mug DNA glycosylase family protein